MGGDNRKSAIRRGLDEVLKPDGYNIGMNLGKVSGAGFPGHLHIHVVPRWKGDINFMPVVGNVKVISQSLKALHEKLTRAHKKRKKDFFKKNSL